VIKMVRGYGKGRFANERQKRKVMSVLNQNNLRSRSYTYSRPVLNERLMRECKDD
jgi:hypothetical protein